MKIDRHVVPAGAEPSRKPEVVANPRQALTAGRDDDVVEVGVPGDDRRGGGLDDVSDVSVRIPLSHTSDGRRREYDVANLAKAEQEDTRN
jgi:hypothetical protein